MVEADHAGDSYAGALPDAFAPIASAVDDLRNTLHRDAGVEPALHRICTDLVGTLSGADAVGVTLFARGRPFTAARSDALVDRIDECQFRTGEGPCLLAAHEHRTVATDDAETRHRFPTFWYANIDTGIRGFLSIPMTVEPGRAGAINIYTNDHRGIGRLEAAAAQIYATTAEAAVSAAARVWSLQARLDAGVRAIESRAVIEQCKGMLMTVFDISADEAFELLRWRSQHTNVPVRILAARLLRAVLGSTSIDNLTRDHVGRLLMAPQP